MAMTLRGTGGLRTAPPPQPTRVDRAAEFLTKWLRIWVVLLVVVTMVVVVYLVVITNTLASINGNLAVANRGVQGTGRNTVTLPAQVDRINGSLAAIDPALKPIPDQADQIIAALSSINDRLAATDASLKDTSSVLSNVTGGVGSIRDVLIDANDPPDRVGVQNIHRRVAAANGTGNCGEFCKPDNLTTIEADAGNILRDLVGINRHLNSVCRSFGASLLAGSSAGC